MAKAREALKGHEINADNLMLLNKKNLNNLANNFRNTMQPQVKDEYSKLNTDAERRAGLAQYILDPQTATCQGFNAHGMQRAWHAIRVQRRTCMAADTHGGQNA